MYKFKNNALFPFFHDDKVECHVTGLGFKGNRDDGLQFNNALHNELKITLIENGDSYTFLAEFFDFAEITLALAKAQDCVDINSSRRQLALFHNTPQNQLINLLVKFSKF
ncbi:MAG: hypothetical protein D9N11_07160 [Ketobacter sp.]|nr:MAG: hypothetical protein D9N11_07160 [Ketobacter sp.]